MTKVYLVKFSARNKNSNHYVNYVLNVFTNKKKATNYAEYKQLRTEVEKPDFLDCYENITYKVYPMDICDIDYSKELLELQTKNLPY